MAFEHYVRSGAKRLRCGFTTGTCAALAASGAAELLLTGAAPETLCLRTPKGLPVEIQPERCAMEGAAAVCAVRKDAGDDPDVTDGLLVCARVERIPAGIRIDGGVGVGRVTKPGLDQPVGAAAINRVPREMIRAALEHVCAEAEYGGGLAVTVFVPEGEAAAKKTFNPMLGIEGGISILGTSGIVEPMSEQAIVDTIAVQIRQAAATGAKRLILAPGNYGLDFLQTELNDLQAIPVVKCSNFIGDAVDLAALEGFDSVLLVGHFGKLVKLAGGVMNTHSAHADCRRELICAHAAVSGAPTEVCRDLMAQATTDGCLAVLERSALRETVTTSLIRAIGTHLARRAGETMAIGAVTFSNEYGLLGMTDTAARLLAEWGRQDEA